MLYRCVWCTTLAKRYYPDCSIRQEHYADVLVSALKDRHLSVEPTRIGYYPPCYERGLEVGGGHVWLLWGTYRRLLGQIEGLTVVNLKPTDCCVRAAADSIEEAKSKGLDTIVNTCISCNAWLLKVSKGSGVKLKLLPEVLLDAVRGRA